MAMTALTTISGEIQSQPLNDNFSHVAAEFNTHLAGYAHIVNVLAEGVTGDGSDETTVMQAALDKAVNSNGIFYVPQGITVTVNSLTVASKSNFKIKIDGYLKRKASGTAIGMLVITGSTDFDIETYHADGNVANNGVTLNEQQHLLSIGTSSNLHFGKIVGKDSGGDVIYINDCDDIQSDSIYGYGEDTGRNTLSIIKGQNMQFSKVVSIGIGTSGMPGGVDIEPNLVTDDVQDIQFGDVYVEGLGTGIFQLTNNFGSVCQHVTVDSLICIKKRRTEASGLRVSLSINKFDNVKIKGIIKEDVTDVTTATTIGAFVVGGNDIDLDLDISNVSIGARIGITTATSNLILRGRIKSTLVNSIDVGSLSNCKIYSIMEDARIGGGNNPHVIFSSGSVVNNLYFVNAGFIKNTSGWVGVYLQGTLNGLYFENCDFRGWANRGEMIGGSATTTGLFRINCKGFNYDSAMPTTNWWNAGEYVENTAPAIAGVSGNRYIINGWRRLTSGSSHTLNTDWAEDRALIESNITGTWTPVIAGTTTAGAHTYANQVGTYVRFGNLVFAQFRVTLSAKDAAMAGTVILTGLPFACVNISGYYQSVSPLWSNITLTAGKTQLIGYIEASQSRILFTELESGAAAGNLPSTAIGNTSELIGCLVYRVV